MIIRDHLLYLSYIKIDTYIYNGFHKYLLSFSADQIARGPINNIISRFLCFYIIHLSLYF